MELISVGTERLGEAGQQTIPSDPADEDECLVLPASVTLRYFDDDPERLLGV